VTFPYASLEERVEAYQKVTPERIRMVACEIFRPENLTLTIKGSKKRIDVEGIKKIISDL